MIFAYMKMLDPRSVVREGEQQQARAIKQNPESNSEGARAGEPKQGSNSKEVSARGQ